MTMKVHQTSKIKDVMAFVIQYQFEINICIEKTQFIQPSENPLIMIFYNWTKLLSSHHQGAFNNHVDIILVFLNQPPMPRGHFLCNKCGQKSQILDHLPTLYYPHGF